MKSSYLLSYVVAQFPPEIPTPLALKLNQLQSITKMLSHILLTESIHIRMCISQYMKLQNPILKACQIVAPQFKSVSLEKLLKF